MIKFDITTRYRNKNCFYGAGAYNGQKVFYKTFQDSSKHELKGYSLVKKYYRVPKIIDYDEKTILYEYIEDLINNTLYEYLYYSDKITSYNLLFNQYRNSMKHFVFKSEDDLVNKKFFKERVYLLNKYIESNKFESYNNTFKDIINKVSEKKELTAYISQGDPTDTNITIDGVFSDFENGGYNSLVGEIAILTISILTHGAYFYPKYNSKVYTIRPKSNTRLSISHRNIDFIFNFLKLIESMINERIKEELNEYLKYYICFRVLTPLNILNMDCKDQKIILKLIDVFYSINSLDELIDCVKNWNVNFMKEVV